MSLPLRQLEPEPRNRAIHAPVVPLFTPLSNAEALIDWLLRYRAGEHYRFIFAPGRMVIALERVDYWVFPSCGHDCIGCFPTEAAALLARCPVCAGGRGSRQWTTLFIDTVADMESRHVATLDATPAALHATPVEGGW